MTRFRAAPRRNLSIAATVALGFVVLVAAFALGVRLDDGATYSQLGAHPAAGVDPRSLGFSLRESLALPFPLREPWLVPSRVAHLGHVALGCLETAVLALLALSLRKTTPRALACAAAGVAAAALAAVALVARTLGSGDVYAYVAYARLGLRGSYAPTVASLPPAYLAVAHVWGSPIVASVYGPAWYALQQAVSGTSTTLGGAVVATRWLGLGSVLVFVALLSAGRLPRRVGILALANPALYANFVIDAHNDLIGIDLVVAAMLVATRVPLGAVALVTLAGLVKLPFAIFALVAFLDRPLRERSACAALSFALVLVASYGLGGAPYVLDVLQRGTREHAQAISLSQLLVFGIAAVAALALLYAFATKRTVRGLAYAMIELGFSTPWSWYYAWGFPYAVLDAWSIETMLVAYPLASALLDRSYAWGFRHF